MSSKIAIQIENVSKQFQIKKSGYAGIKGKIGALTKGIKPEVEIITALDDVSLNIYKGETIALIGRNGSGKSTLLAQIANVMHPDTGTITFPASADPKHPRMAPLLEVGAGFHPDLTGRQNVFFNGIILGVPRAEMVKRYDDIIAFADFENPTYLDAPVRTYSDGMHVRLGFAVAVHTDPEVILVDETLAVGDAAFQEKCLAKIAEFQQEQRTIVVVSHDMNAIRRVATRALWLSHGKITEDGDPEEVIEKYLTDVSQAHH
jgi:ABC-type polysaccharide/polyol phosphate transport system ATPase subunit